MKIEIVDVTTIGQLSDPEIDELLERSINPRMPIEVFYAVLDRIGGIPAAAAPAALAPMPTAPITTVPIPTAPITDEAVAEVGV